MEALLGAGLKAVLKNDSFSVKELHLKTQTGIYEVQGSVAFSLAGQFTPKYYSRADRVSVCQTEIAVHECRPAAKV